MAEPTIYVVDDDEGVRDSLAALLEADGFRVVAYASAEAFLKRDGIDADACLLADVRMPGMDGLELLGRLADQRRVLPVIMITGHGDVPMAVRAMKLGAVDFIEKPFDPEVILASVREALRAASARPSGADEEVQRRLQQLTPRERDVLEHLVVGRSNKEVALQLGISPRTVEIHRARLMEKMQAENLAQLVRMAIAVGIDPSPI